ncbi:MAG: DUF2089 family protein [Bacteroidales bacterium]
MNDQKGKEKILPRQCPSCYSLLKVKQLHCEHCHTHIEGLYEFSVLMQLDEEEQAFILNFVKNSGSLKKMANKLRLSYPTIRNKLNDIIENIEQVERKNGTNDKMDN